MYTYINVIYNTYVCVLRTQNIYSLYVCACLCVCVCKHTHTNISKEKQKYQHQQLCDPVTDRHGFTTTLSEIEWNHVNDQVRVARKWKYWHLKKWKGNHTDFWSLPKMPKRILPWCMCEKMHGQVVKVLARDCNIASFKPQTRW